ncbi:MAG: hypothetical protein QMD09_14800 [Desulfatibacillaceae bacterium]|nr:hypothetical protein [Desulfatibacillaceae bacterium]
MQESFSKTISLENGLLLTIKDISRKIADGEPNPKLHDTRNKRVVAGDIWYLGLKLSMEIPVCRALAHLEPEKIAQIEKVLGKSVLYEKTLSRNLIHESEKDEVFVQLLEGLEKSLLLYLGRPKFAQNHVLKLFAQKTGPISPRSPGW